MRAVLSTLFLVVATALALPTTTGKRSRLDPDKIMNDVYNMKGFTDFGDLKISPQLYDEVLDQFRRFERDFPDLEEEGEEEEIEIPVPQEPVRQHPLRPTVPTTEAPRPPIFPGFKMRFFRML